MNLFHFDALDKQGGHQVAGDVAVFKRDAFRDAFAGFDPDAVAAFGPADVKRLMADAGIVRNRAKVDATLNNARATVGLRSGGGLDTLIWSHRPARDPGPRATDQVPTVSEESKALAKELKARGFAFVGPTTAHALMEAIGVVDTHLLGCHRRGATG